MPRTLSHVLGVALLGAVTFAQSKPVALERELAKKISTLADVWWKARPPTRFVEWDRAARAQIEAQARALGVIPEGSLDAVVALLRANSKKLGPQAESAKGKLTLDTPYGKAWCHFVAGGKNPGLFVGLHGGGEDAGSADEARSTWQVKGCAGIYPQGIKLIHDTWNAVHGERFVLSLIELAKAQYDVDPDRVYVGGFSMGGTGSWFLAGRHPDLFAGAAPYSGVLMASPQSQLATKEEVRAIQHGLVPNVRNLAMHYTIGLDDPRTMPGTYLFVADVLASLRAKDPEGYAKIHFQAVPDLVHEFPKGEPARGLEFLLNERRERFPSKLVWEYTRDPSPSPEANEPAARIQKTLFYWLGCRDPRDFQTIRAARTGNTITLEVSQTKDGVKGITLFLNPSMIDPAADVVVKSGEVELYRGKPAPDVWTVLETFDDKLDRTLVFDRRIEL